MTGVFGFGKVRVGCCGFPVVREEYFGKFKLVEIQQSFYKLPKPETARKWRQEAPADFEFTLKAPQLITHPPTSPTYRKAGIKIAPGTEGNYGFFRPSPEVHQAWEETAKFAQELGARVILFQCPPSFRETEENIANMREFFGLARGSGFILVWEPRGDWSERTIKSICLELGLVHCVDPMEAGPLAGELGYFRLHGGPGYRHQYSKEELEQLRDRLGERESYVLFNNLNMYHDAQAFIRLLEGGDV